MVNFEKDWNFIPFQKLIASFHKSFTDVNAMRITNTQASLFSISNKNKPLARSCSPIFFCAFSVT